ncbi:glycolate oxidase subunit GlcF [Methylopila sp. M107]|uniref:glycolate oxidase subunit GlcF n=1 Tax=Methylopila sp. M107 TaxID=1101190 RepID=UPI0004784731|nr:glycolate oxidase subunit GlcF [Methylopila sp. M107]
MQTTFSLAELADPDISRSNEILRSCVHCGFCTATCPTYAVLGDELDSPRGRIYLIKEMLEGEDAPAVSTVTHIDRCLSCLSCMTTCPSGVHYMHLVDHARAHIERTFRRRCDDRLLRWMLAKILPFPARFRFSLRLARFVKPLSGLVPDARLRAMLDLQPKATPKPSANDQPQRFKAMGTRRRRVALLTGCAQRVLNTDINDATIRLLTRHGCEVVVVEGAGCCGALTHHLGKTRASHAAAAANIRAFIAEMDGEGLDAIIVNTSGCGTTMKDYAHMFRSEELGDAATRVSKATKDVSELLGELRLKAPDHAEPLRVAYHAACSLQHGQQIISAPKDLLAEAGFMVVEPANSHLCCGSAGVYNILQPKIATELGARKAETLAELDPDVVCAGNIGCMTQIASSLEAPVAHLVELLDWATGGPKPPVLSVIHGQSSTISGS